MTRKLRLLLASSALLIAIAVTARAGHVTAQGTFQAPGLAAANCQNIQLLIRPFMGSGAAGHYGEVYRIQNISNRSCTLTGFPGVVLLDSRFNSLPTHVTWTTQIAGNHSVRLVQLPSHGSAYFLLFWADVPTGNESCPAAQYLMITAPNDRLPDVTFASPGTIMPCGGRISASPVVSTRFSL